MSSLLTRNRGAMERALSGTSRRRYLSPAVYCLYAAFVPRLTQHATGAVLDAGCGTMPFRDLLMRLSSSYSSMDVEERAGPTDYVADIQDMPMVPAQTFDTVVCTEVLEHVARPDRALAEIARVLKPGGKVLLSVPYLCRLHEEPHDYFRYTAHGLRALLERSGFRVLETVPTGSIFSFIGHQVSSVVLCSVWHVPVVRSVVFWLNGICCTVPCYWADRLSGFGWKLPLGYVAVAERAAAAPPPGDAGARQLSSPVVIPRPDLV